MSSTSPSGAPSGSAAGRPCQARAVSGGGSGIRFLLLVVRRGRRPRAWWARRPDAWDRIISHSCRWRCPTGTRANPTRSSSANPSRPLGRIWLHRHCNDRCTARKHAGNIAAIPTGAGIRDAFTLKEAAVDTGDTAWLLTSSALVMFMLPGLALFYGGMVRAKNVLSTVVQSFFALGIVGTLWVLIGYTLAFGGDAFGGLIGNLEFIGFRHVDGTGTYPYAVQTVPHLAFA